MGNEESFRWNLEQLKKQSKDLLKMANRGVPAAVKRFEELGLRGTTESGGGFQLSQAQFVIARSAGFDSWQKLRIRVEHDVEAAFFDAIRKGDVRGLKRLGREFPQMLQQREHRSGLLPIQLAAFEGKRELVDLFLRLGANPTQGNPPIRSQSHALYYAESRGFDDIVQLIRQWLAKKRRHTETAQRLCDAIRCHENESVARMLLTDPSLVKATEFGNSSGLDGGDSVLHFAIEHDNVHAVELLIDAGASLTEKCLRGRTAIRRALSFLVGFGHRPGLDKALDYQARFRIATLLLERGAKRDLWVECCLGNMPGVEALVAADPRAVNRTVNPTNAAGGFAMDHFPLSGAAGGGHLEIVDFLLRHGADANAAYRLTDCAHLDRGAPLELAVRNENIELATLLLEKGADPDTSRYACSNAMQTAIATGNNPLIDLLLRKGAAIGFDGKLDLQWSNGQNIMQQSAYLQMSQAPGLELALQCLISAAREGTPALLELSLRRLPAIPEDLMFSLLESVTEMWRIYVAGDSKVKSEDYFECLNLLLGGGVDPNATSLRGETCLHRLSRMTPYPSEEHRICFAEILLEKGANPNLCDELEVISPLSLAQRSGLNRLYEVLAGAGAGAS